MSRKEKPVHCLYDVVNNLGGELVELRFLPARGANGGCGSPTHVVGTNGETMPWGGMLHRLDGSSAPYYCAACGKALGATAASPR